MPVNLDKYWVAVDEAATQNKYLHESLSTRELEPKYPAIKAADLKKRGPAYLPAYEAYSFFASAFRHRRDETTSHLIQASETMPMIVDILSTINDPEYEILDADSVVRMTNDLNDMVDKGASLVKKANRLLEQIRASDYESRAIAAMDHATLDRRHRKLTYHRQRVPQIIITDPESEETGYHIWPAAPEQPVMNADPICSLVRDRVHNSLCPCHRKKADRRFECVDRFMSPRPGRSDLIDRRKSI